MLSSINFSIAGTTTAGDTAAIIKPSRADSRMLILKKNGVTSVMTAPSNTAGRNPIRMAVLPTLLSVSLFVASPALKRITISAIILKSDDTFIKTGSIRLKT